jgi:hypothetical protein
MRNINNIPASPTHTLSGSKKYDKSHPNFQPARQPRQRRRLNLAGLGHRDLQLMTVGAAAAAAAEASAAQQQQVETAAAAAALQLQQNGQRVPILKII